MLFKQTNMHLNFYQKRYMLEIIILAIDTGTQVGSFITKNN